MFLKICKKIVAALTVTVVLTTAVSAQTHTVPGELTTYGQQIYAGAKSYFSRRSFSGYCGTYVKCQLRAMGIFKDQFDFYGNGNQWYSNFDNVDMTSGGYYVYQESGSDCIEKLTDKYGSNLKNIVLSFPIQSHHTARNPGAGHAFILYELRDGIAYYSESFSTGGHREGEVIAEEVDSLIERYSTRHGELIGCVMLSKEDMQQTSLEGFTCLNGYESWNFSDEVMLAEARTKLESMSNITFITTELTEISKSRVEA